MSAERYFPQGGGEARKLLDDYLARLGQAASSLPSLRLLLLGGGYGRGEGGLWKEPDGAERLYNDLEFYVLVTATHPAQEAWVRQQEVEGHRVTGIEVEFKIMRDESLRRARPSMFYYDLLAGHLTVAGDGTWLQTLPAVLRDPAAIPPDEATRLLMNRGCSLLLCARAAAGRGGADEAFADRIAAKLKLALGDAVLCSRGLYHWSCRERGRRLADLADESLPHPVVLRRWHHEAVEFKLHPRPEARAMAERGPEIAELRLVWRDLFLRLEETRLGVAFPSPAAYAGFSGPLLPHEAPAGNVVRRLRALARGRRLPGSWIRHPRETVLRAMVLLLDPERTADGVSQAACLLGCRPGADEAVVEDALRALWKGWQ